MNTPCMGTYPKQCCHFGVLSASYGDEYEDEEEDEDAYEDEDEDDDDDDDEDVALCLSMLNVSFTKQSHGMVHGLS